MAAAENVVACETCGLVQRLEPLEKGTAAECFRCGTFLGVRKSSASLHVTAALSLAALVLYVPANIYPILRMEMYGAHSDNTIWDGVASLMQHGQWGVAVIVFMASMVIPLVKLGGLFVLVLSSMAQKGRRLRWRTGLYKFIDTVGPWAMLDVFLLAVLVSLVKLGQLATVVPGPGLIAFTGVVVLTMLASSAFDPKLIWERR
ncbi:MAG: paraquat-inducible protein [Betaproteobacteria bacterium]|jgi:paraquat-inducible protein A|nr:paraquat-inducible protein [Betaproteobacteria bacterium]